MIERAETEGAIEEFPLGEHLDTGIRREVEVLRANGVETTESCQGGQGHSYPEPTVRFSGERAAGFRAYAVAVENGLPVSALRRVWYVIDGELAGPEWEMTFRHEGVGPCPIDQSGGTVTWEWR